MISLKKIASGIINALTACMNPLIPLFVVVGLANISALLIGPMFLNLVTEKSDLYTNFIFIGRSVIYFIPVFAAVTASDYFKSNKMIAVAMAAMMLFPDMIDALAVAEGYSFFGIPVPNIAYQGQLIPILLAVFIQSHIEKYLSKIIKSEAVSRFVIPFATLIIMSPLIFIILGPAGYYIGFVLAGAILWLYDVAGPVQTMLLGSASLFLMASGVTRPVFIISLNLLITNGVEFSFLPIVMITQNWVAAGIAAGYFIKAKAAENKQTGITSLATVAFGGVSEPILYGIILPNKKTYLPVVLAGAFSGLLLGVFRVGYYQFAPSSILGLIGFIGGDDNNLLFGVSASLAAFVAAFLLMLLLFKDTNLEEENV